MQTVLLTSTPISAGRLRDASGPEGMSDEVVATAPDTTAYRRRLGMRVDQVTPCGRIDPTPDPPTPRPDPSPPPAPQPPAPAPSPGPAGPIIV